MILEIESYQGDALLIGADRSFSELKAQLADIENCCDRQSDNFIPLLCRKYQFDLLDISVDFDYNYDRDLKKLTRRRLQ